MTGLAFVDTETTGTDPNRHAMWEIGLVVGEDEYQWILRLTDEQMAVAEPMALSVGDYYRRHYETELAQTPRRALTFTGSFSENENQALKDKKYMIPPDFPQLADFIARKTHKCHLVGAVPSFDDRFLGDFLRKYNRPPSWHYHLVDVEALAAGKLGWEPPWKSKDLYRAVGIDPEFFDQHTALGDARMARAVYHKVFNLQPPYGGALLPVSDKREENANPQT